MIRSDYPGRKTPPPLYKISRPWQMLYFILERPLKLARYGSLCNSAHGSLRWFSKVTACVRWDQQGLRSFINTQPLNFRSTETTFSVHCFDFLWNTDLSDTFFIYFFEQGIFHVHASGVSHFCQISNLVFSITQVYCTLQFYTFLVTQKIYRYRHT